MKSKLLNIFVIILFYLPINCSAEYMQVTLLGVGSPRPNVDRTGPTGLVEAGGMNLLFDAGHDVVTRLTQQDVPSSSIQHVFLTHLH